ncbi:MAG: hypothetical protein HY914_01590 [Desulfomonile tiedjei]|nr:hypothetical protein [Desulfomonile tiedjei]
MRSLVVAMMCVALVAGVYGTAHSVGYTVVGKEEVVCSPLVARGVIPDCLNLLTEAVRFPRLAQAVDGLAVEIRSFADQFAAPPESAVAEISEPTTESKVSGEKPAREEAVGKEEKAAKEAVSADEKSKKPATKAKTQQKKRKVKVPPRAK